MTRWRAEYDDGIWRFYRDGMELGLYEKGDVVVDALNVAESRIAELEAENAVLKERVAMLDVTAVYKSLGEMGYIEQVDKLNARIAELEAERRWRIIADGEMPEDRATVLVAFTEYPEQIDILTATYYKRYEGFGGVDNWWRIEGWHSGNVTHWMPLPQPPEVQQ